MWLILTVVCVTGGFTGHRIEGRGNAQKQEQYTLQCKHIVGILVRGCKKEEKYTHIKTKITSLMIK